MNREEYMSAPRDQAQAAHRQYYGQFVNAATIRAIVNRIGAPRLLASTDAHLNDIPLADWDKAAKGIPMAISFKSVNDFPTLGGLVCVAKEAARQWIDQQKAVLSGQGAA